MTATKTYPFEVIELHPTFACEVKGVDFTKPITPELAKDLREVSDKYGVVVFRKTGLTDEAHIELSRYFGELDDVKPYVQAGRTHRLAYPELFDAGNINPFTKDVAPLTDAQVIGNKANEQFHVDSSFNARRAGHSLLLAWVLPPKGTGGATEFSDSRTAYDDLSPEMKKKLEGLVANHSLFHSRKKAMPEYFKDMDPSKMEMSKHKLVQLHESSGRMNLYIASYVHHIDDMPKDESTALIEELLAHVSQPKYVHRVEWEDNGDMICWDNTSVMHRATGGTYEGKFPRDMRRTTVRDMSSTRWGLNGDGSDWRVGMP
ncbi:taurine catabolism dioxygenase [Meredithblackwellia eburnea MCA 4105]